MRLIVVINAYNEAQNIAKAIESVHDVADEVWLFDGAYEEYPHDKVYSTDGMLKIARKYKKVKIYECKTAWKNQLEKRTAMFKDGKDGDYFFKLDGDEYVTNPEIIRNYLGCDVGWSWVLSNLYEEPVMTTRLFKFRKGMHYAGRHHWLYDGNNTFIASDQNYNPRFNQLDTEIRIVNFRDSSSPKRKPDKRQFLTNRHEYEGLYQHEDEVYPERGVRLVAHQHRAGKPRENTQVIKSCENPKYTMSLMFSRLWAIQPYFNHLKNLKIPENTEMICVIDSNEDYMRRAVTEKLIKSNKFAGIKVIFTGREKVGEFRNVSVRRQRIVDNWNYILAEARGEILLGSEDDSLPQYDAYDKLLETMEKEKADFVQGNIIGRWHCKMCPAWKVIERDGMPVAVYNEAEKPSGVSEVQGVGWYCFVTTVDLMRKYAMKLDNLLPLGPDLRFGYELYRNGYKLLHDWNVKVEHFGEEFNLRVGDEQTEQRLWKLNENGEWILNDYTPEVLKLIEIGR